MQLPWLQYPYAQKKAPTTPREVLLDYLENGVPLALALRATLIKEEDVKGDAEVDQALAIGEILLFERARDSGVTGVIRAAQRYETKSWTPKAEATIGLSIEDYLRD